MRSSTKLAILAITGLGVSACSLKPKFVTVAADGGWRRAVSAKITGFNA